MRQHLRRQMLDTARWLLARRALYPLNRALLRLCLKNIGINNYETPALTGEATFLQRIGAGLNPLVVFDVGANVGSYANRLRAAAPHARIYAFEPHPRTFERLQQAAAQHGYTALPVGCGAAPATLMLYDTQPDGSSHASLYQAVVADQPTARAVEVQLTTVDRAAAEHGISHIHLLKVDTEGHEVQVLRGAEQLLHSGGIDLIQFEFDRMAVASRVFFKDFYDLLPDYRFYRLLPRSLVALGAYDPLLCEVYAFQNIVAVRHDKEALLQRLYA